MRWLSHRGGALDFREFQIQNPGKNYPVAVALGADPATILGAVTPVPDTLSEYGFAVIDFMNVTQVIETLVPEEVKTVDEIDFHIKRYVEDGHIFKEIDFEDQSRKFHFTEKVKAITLEDFEIMMEKAGIYLLDIFGDYKLKKFHKKESERLILIFK